MLITSVATGVKTIPLNMQDIPSLSIISSLINFLPVHRFGSHCFKSHIPTLNGTSISTESSLDSKIFDVSKSNNKIK